MPETIAEYADETRFEDGPVGPSSRGVCKVLNRNSCGSGSLVGQRNGRSLVLTNAHVAGTRIGNAVSCTFPHDQNRRVNGRVIMAGYSDRVLMDWAVLELDRLVDLPHVKLMNRKPQGGHYTAGYPRCRGPYYQVIHTQSISHGGTLWRWHPNAIGGQSGSAVHSEEDQYQYGLLTWSWGGDGAGQTVWSIWEQYVRRAEWGAARPDDLVEINEELAEVERGVFCESNITTLPIWAHLDDDDDDDGGQDPIPDKKFLSQLLANAEQQYRAAQDMVELIRRYRDDPSDDNDNDEDNGNDNDDCLFGLCK